MGIIAALVIALILLFFTAPMAWIPQAALGAVLLMAGWGLIDIQAMRVIRKLSRFEFWLCVLTTLGVIGVGVLPGIIVAVLLAILRLLKSIYQPTDAVLGWVRGIEGQVDISQYPQARTLAGLVVYRFDDAILFFNADYFKARLLEAVEREPEPRAVLFVAEAVTSIDVSGIVALREVRDTLLARGIVLGIARPHGTFLRMLVRSGLARELEQKLLFASVRAGIRAYRIWRNQVQREALKDEQRAGTA